MRGVFGIGASLCVLWVLVRAFLWMHDNDPVERMHREADGYRYCVDACGDHGVAGYGATSSEYVCTCKGVTR